MHIYTHISILKHICIVINMEVNICTLSYTYREGYKKEGILLEVDEEEDK